MNENVICTYTGFKMFSIKYETTICHTRSEEIIRVCKKMKRKSVCVCAAPVLLEHVMDARFTSCGRAPAPVHAAPRTTTTR